MKVRVRESKGEIEKSYGKYRSEYWINGCWKSTYRNLNSITQNAFNTYEEAYNECIWFAKEHDEEPEFTKKHYKWALIEGSNIKLFNESTVKFTVLTTDALENVNVEIDNGVLSIEADRIIYFYATAKLWEDEWKEEPEPKLIKEGKCYWFSKKVKRYVEKGWIRTTKREKVKYIINNYKIEILE